MRRLVNSAVTTVLMSMGLLDQVPAPGERKSDPSPVQRIKDNDEST